MRFVGDRYHIVRELGRGGMGVVYLGRDLRHDMDVAIKVRGMAHTDATLWLKREFRAVASLRHPNLVELYELVVHDHACYFTMEYLPGRDPRHWVEHTQPAPGASADSVGETTTAVPLQEARTAPSLATGAPPASVFARPVPAVDFARVQSVLAQLAEGLAFLHSRGVLHRDVKPSNVIVVGDTVKLLDFGLALEQHRHHEGIAPESRVVGTAAYLAPEYLDRLEVSPQMDVYSLGVLAYELCTGSPPFGGALHVLARMTTRVEVPRPRQHNPSVPEELDELITAMLANDPAARPSALEVALRLTGAQSQPRVVRRTARFIGRGDELARIAARIADPTPRARLVLVTGSSGAGKSALIDEAVGRARNAETLIWRGRCHERERVAYRAFDLIIDDLATELAGDLRLAHEIDHPNALARVFPVLAPLLAPACAPENTAADLRVERERAHGSLTQLFARLMTAPRGVITIDDLQWADEDSLELLALLVERIERPLTILASWTTHCAEEEGPRALLERLGDALEVLDVSRMDTDELAHLIAELAPGAPRARIAAAAELSAGSPYLAELIGSELGDTDVADPREAEHRRLARLAAEERTVADIAALAVGAASFDQLRALADLPAGRLQSVLRGLEHARIVRATPATSGDPVYVFYHQRLREAAITAMRPEARRDVHERFARWFERTGGDPGQLAHHWHEAGDRAQAARWAVAAGDAAKDQLAWSLAADWYAHARALGDDAVATRERLAESLFLGGRLAAAATEFLALAGKEPRADESDHWRVRAAEAYLKLGELERGLGVLDGVLASRGAPRTRHRAVSMLRAASVAARWLAPVRAPVGRADPVLSTAYRVIASFLSTPYPIESFEYVLRGVAHAEHTGDRAAHAMGMAMIAAYVATGSLGRFGDRAISRARRLLAESEVPYPEMVVAGAHGMLVMLRGDWDGMRVAHEQAERVCRRLGLERSWEASFLRTYWGLGELYAGEPARASELLATVADTSEDLWTRAMLGSCRGRVLVATGQLEEARQLARELSRARETQRGMASIHRQVFLAELALAERAWSRARRLGDELARSARSQWLSAMPAVSAMIDVVLATAALGEAVEHGDLARAADALDTARRLYRRGRWSFYAVTALRLWGQAARLLGEHAESERAFARAGAMAVARGGKVDRLALQALAGAAIDAGPLAPAVLWSTGGMLDGGT